MSDLADPPTGAPPPHAPPPPAPPDPRPEISGDALASEVCANRGPVRRERLTVRGRFDLQSTTVAHRLELRDVTFEDLVDLRDARFLKTVDLRGCTFRAGVRMEGTQVDGTLLMNRATIGLLPGDKRQRAARMSLLKLNGHLLAQGLEAAGGIDLTRAGVRGHLDFSSLADRRTDCAGDLIMNVARIGGDVRLAGMLLGGDLKAESTRVSADFAAGPRREHPERNDGDVLEVTHIRGKANLSGSRITGQVRFEAAMIEKGLQFQAAVIRGGLFCRTVLGRQPEIGVALEGPAAHILATLDLSGARIAGKVFLDGAHVHGTVFLSSGWICDGGAPRSPDGSATPPAVSPREPDLRTRIAGELMMNHASVGGSIRVIDASLGGGAALSGAMVTGAVSFSQTSVAGKIDLEAASVTGGFYCRCGDGLRPEVGGSIEGKGAQVGAGIFMSGADVSGDVLFTESIIKGPVEMEAVCVASPVAEEPDGTAAPASGQVPASAAPATVVRGTVDFGHSKVSGALKLAGIEAGMIRLVGASVAGALDLAGARIGSMEHGSPDDRPDLARGAGEAERIAVRATGLRLGGAARLAGVRIGGDVYLQTGRLEGGLFCCATIEQGRVTSERPDVFGSIHLGGTTILVEADFRAAAITGDLSLERATVDGRLRCRLVAPNGEDWREHRCTELRQLNLRNCDVDYLDLQGIERRGGVDADPTWSQCCTAQDVPILMEGCQFRELSVPGNEKDKDYTFFFRRQDASAFRQSDYVLVEQWLRERGEDEAAERVHRVMRERQRAALRDPHRRAGNWVVLALRAVALRFENLIVAALVVYVLSVAIFHGHGSVVARDSTASPPARWETTDALMTAAQVHLPMLTLPGRSRWEPARSGIRVGDTELPLRYDLYAMLVSLLSYVVIPLVIGGIASTWLRRGMGRR